MPINQGLWAERQYGVLVSFVHNLAYYRVLWQTLFESSMKSEFWIRTTDAHLLNTVLNWCMIFGADSSNLHWKKVITDEPGQMAFRKHLYGFPGLSEHEWNLLWRQMTAFRNKYVAHRDSACPPVPFMDPALRTATVYDEWFRKNSGAIFEEPTLNQRYERLLRTAQTPLKMAVALGPAVEQEYEGRVPSRGSGD